MNSALDLSFKKRSTKELIIALFLVPALYLFWPLEAQAQNNGGTNVGQVICNAYISMYGGGASTLSLASLFSGFAYIAGAFFLGNGLYKFKESADNPARMPIHIPIARVIGGTCLLALPNMLGYIVSSIFTQTTSGGLTVSTCTAPVAGNLANLDPSLWFSNLINNISMPLMSLLSVLGYVVGTFLVVRGFIKLSKFGTDPKAYSLPAILANIIVGAMLFSLGTVETTLFSSIFGTATAETSTQANVAGWKMVTAFGGNTASFVTAITAAITFFRVMGAVAFFRGLLILKHTVEGSGQATLAAGFTHLIGGIICLNMFYVLKAFDFTLGTALL